MLLSETKSAPRWIKVLPATPIGPITVIVSEQGLLKVDFSPDTKSQNPTHNIAASGASPILDLALDEIVAYLDGTLRTFSIPIDWSTISTFDQIVLKASLQIQYGEIVTYGYLASSIGRPSAARATGGALGRNPMPLVIPCHRVVGADRRLHGYSGPGGLATKAWLLQREGCRIVDQRVA
jgi:methylated-DNA-[protein]-cysteine S-methyltransferase